jgi:hypothetical protein
MSLKTVKTIYGDGTLIGELPGGTFWVAAAKSDVKIPEDKGDEETKKLVRRSMKKGGRVIHIEVRPEDIIDG